VPTSKHVLTLTLVLGLCLDITALSQEAPPFPDVNPNGFIDSSDLFALASGWRNEADLSGRDVDGSGRVGPEDLSALLQQWRTNDLKLLWAKRAGGPRGDGGSGITSSGDGGVIATGRFSGSATFGEDDHQVTLESAGGSNIFVAKYNSDGELVWVRRAGGHRDDTGRAIDSFPDGSFVVAGSFVRTATFGNGNREVVLNAGLFQSFFVAKYDSNGNLIWVKAPGISPTADADAYMPGSIGETVTPVGAVHGIAATADGGAYLSGTFRETLTFGEEGRGGERRPVTLTPEAKYDAFIAKYNANGSLSWVRRDGVNDPMKYNLGLGITSLPDGSAAMSGLKGVRPSITEETAPGDPFVSKYNSNGTIAWERKWRSPFPALGEGIAVFSNGSVVVAGHFSSSATFGEEILLTSAGSTDLFLAKYNSEGDLSWALSDGGPQLDAAFGVAVSADDSILVTGTFEQRARSGGSTFGEGTRRATLTSQGEDVFVVKYNPDGSLAATTSAGGPETDRGNAITTLPDGSVVVTGSFNGSATFGEGEDQVVLNSEGESDVFIARYISIGSQ